MPMPKEPAAATQPISKGGVLAYVAASVLAIGAAGVMTSFNSAVKKAQDSDPIFVIPTAQQRIEDMGFSNVRFYSFNKQADKPAALDFTADKDGLAYSGEAHCSSTHCPRITIKMDAAQKLGS
jgi:hypothetical protein